MKIRLVFLLVFNSILLPAFGYAQNSSIEKIRQLAEKEISSLCEECEITVTPKWIHTSIENLNSQKIVEIEFKEVGLPKGYQNARVFYRDNAELLSRDVQLHIRVEKRLPVAAKRIERNEVIFHTDLAMRMTDITRLQRIPIDSKEQILNQYAAGLIRKGNVIYRSSLQKKPVIKAGDLVEMIYEEGGVEVALNCNAREDKAEGENIRLYSEKTRKTYIGKVLSAEKVLWVKTL